MISRFDWQKIKHISHRLLSPTCVLCGTFNLKPRNICEECYKLLPFLDNHCQICAQPMCVTSQNICGRCLSHKPPFSLTHAMFYYQPPITHFIIGLKFQSKLIYAQTLGEFLTEKIEQDWYKSKPLPDLIIPIPLHPKRLLERGFNQAIEIARPIAKKLHIPIEKQGIKRIKYTMPQSNLSASARRKNIANAFKISRNYSNLTIAVLDDVVTTGQTMIEFCKMLKNAGAKEIHVWCCARR